MENFIKKCQTEGELIEKLITEYYLNLPADSSYFDGGCHKGYHSFRAARHFREKIIAVDANMSVFEEFMQILSKKDDITKDRIIPMFGALQSDPSVESVSFYCSSSHPGRSSLNQKLWKKWRNDVEYENGMNVPALTIDQTVINNNIQKLSFIKLDLEGGEFGALKGAVNVLRSHRPHVVLEFSLKSHNENLLGYTKEKFYSFLDSINYTMLSPWASVVDASVDYPFWYAFAIPDEEVMNSKKDLKRIFDKYSND